MCRSETALSKLLVFTLALIAVSISQALSAPAHTIFLRGSDVSDPVADFRNASFIAVDLSGANLSHANLAGADVSRAAMLATTLNGADLTRVKGLSQKQLDRACGDAGTKVPAGMKVHRCS